MGGEESKQTGERTLFTEEEQVYVQKCYELFTKEKSLKYLHENLNEKINKHLRHSHQHKGKDKAPFALSTFQDFVGHCLRGTVTDKSQTLLKFSYPKDDTVSAQNLYETVYSFVLTFNSIVNSLPQWKCWKTTEDKEGDKRFTISLFFELFAKGVSKKAEIPKLCVPTDVNYTADEIEEWLTKTPMLIWILDIVFRNVFSLQEETTRKEVLRSSIHIPIITNSKTLPISTILDRHAIIYLNNYNLPKHLTTEWRLLFCNSLYGDSYSQLVRQIVGKGPSLIVVKDKNGYIFGGFTSQSWELNAKFYGSEDNFLFTISPQYGVFTTTGYNSNFMYLNQGQSTLPNGLGMGGQFNYFGFWIDESFNHGHSKAQPRCTTYGSPQLSKFPEFDVEIVEVWGLGPEPKLHGSDEDSDEEKKKSVLDDTETKAMMEIIGKPRHSEGLREMDEDEELSEEMKKKMNTIPKMF